MSRAEVAGIGAAIIGVGSPFGSDRLGWLAVEWLQQRELDKRFPELNLLFELADRPGALLLDRLGSVDAAIIIDAMQAGLPFGTVRQFTPEQLLARHTGLCSSHAFGVSEAIELGAALGALPPRLAIIGIEMGNGGDEPSLPDSTKQQLLPPVEGFLCSAGSSE